MTSFKSLLQRVTVRPAGRRCNCAHNKKHLIMKGEPRLIVKAPGVATPEKGYCAECGLKMVVGARKDLDDLQAGLANS